MKDYQLRYNNPATGINYGIVRATSLERAGELGRQWCQDRNLRFCAVTDPLLVVEEVEGVKVPADRTGGKTAKVA